MNHRLICAPCHTEALIRYGGTGACKPEMMKPSPYQVLRGPDSFHSSFVSHLKRRTHTPYFEKSTSLLWVFSGQTPRSTVESTYFRTRPESSTPYSTTPEGYTTPFKADPFVLPQKPSPWLTSYKNVNTPVRPTQPLHQSLTQRGKRLHSDAPCRQTLYPQELSLHPLLCEKALSFFPPYWISWFCLRFSSRKVSSWLLPEVSRFAARLLFISKSALGERLVVIINKVIFKG